MRNLTLLAAPLLLAGTLQFSGCTGSSSVQTSAYYGVGYSPNYYSHWHGNRNIIVVPPNRPVRPTPPANRPNPPPRPRPQPRR